MRVPTTFLVGALTIALPTSLIGLPAVEAKESTRAKATQCDDGAIRVSTADAISFRTKAQIGSLDIGIGRTKERVSRVFSRRCPTGCASADTEIVLTPWLFMGNNWIRIRGEELDAEIMTGAKPVFHLQMRPSLSRSNVDIDPTSMGRPKDEASGRDQDRPGARITDSNETTDVLVCVLR